MPGQTGSGKTYTMEGCGFPNVTENALRLRNYQPIQDKLMLKVWLVLTRNQDDLTDHEKLSRI